MSLVSNLVEQIGGELRIDRADRNDSTRFTVSIGLTRQSAHGVATVATNAA
jgi:hypothetical protein